MKIYKIFSLIMIFTLLFAVGCSDRGVNYDKDAYELQQGELVGNEGAHNFYNELTFQISNKFQQFDMVAYLPKAALPVQYGGEYRSVPMLVLLPPQDGDMYFYLSHGLKEIADEMISKGEIQPMAILCLQNDKIFGGYFFAGNSPAAGYYDSLIGSALIDYVESDVLPTTLKTKTKRGIGGVGMGAYGAYRAAMIHPDKFGSVSGVAGPMDFDGNDGNSGFISLFDDVLNEQGIMGQNLRDNFDYKISGDNFGEWPLTRLFVGGGLAFSPHDTLIDFDTTHLINPNTHTHFISFIINARETLPRSITDDNYISFAAKTVMPNNPILHYGFYLPFDQNGNIENIADATGIGIWDRWLNNNLETLLGERPGVFNGVNLWIGNSSQATFGNFSSQTESWKNTLTAEYTVTEFNLSGYSGHPAQRNQYVYDYIKEMLIFHSESFGN